MDEEITTLELFQTLDWISPILHAAMGYTVVLFESDEFDEACMWCFALRVNKVDCVLGGGFGYYYVLGKEVEED